MKTGSRAEPASRRVPAGVAAVFACLAVAGCLSLPRETTRYMDALEPGASRGFVELYYADSAGPVDSRVMCGVFGDRLYAFPGPDLAARTRVACPPACSALS